MKISNFTDFNNKKIIKESEDTNLEYCIIKNSIVTSSGILSSGKHLKLYDSNQDLVGILTESNKFFDLVEVYHYEVK